MSYRPDIDGLRALAVTLVVLFHAGVMFPGGYIGVDIFFVLSGFLVTGIIVNDLENDRFSMRRFWLRRARRILPASLLVVSATLIAGWFCLLPVDFRELAEAAISVQAFCANMFYWINTGYFSGSSDLKPLLHTWSLSVEEQFYLFHPIAICLLMSKGKVLLNWSLSAVGVGSLLLCVIGTEVDQNATFYLLPTRAWELLVGALIWQVPKSLSRSYAEVASLSACASICIAATVMTSATPFPGFAAVVPCVATGMLLVANFDQQTSVSRLLGWAPVAWLGRLSYSWYLWHWPVLAMYRHLYGTDLDAAKTWQAILMGFAIAVVAYYGFENPIRRLRQRFSDKMVVSGIIIWLTVLTISASFIVALDGIPKRLSPAALKYAEASQSSDFLYEVALADAEAGRFPDFGAVSGTRSCLVWGDSHAMAMMPAFDLVCRERGIRGYQATYSATPPAFDVVYRDPWGLSEDGNAFGRAAVKFAVQNDVDVVFISASWTSYIKVNGIREGLSAAVDLLRSAGISVVIIDTIPAQREDVPIMLSRAVRFGQDVTTFGVPLERYLESSHAVRRWLRSLTKDEVIVVSPHIALLDDKNLLRAELDGHAMYRDAAHLTVEGATKQAPLVRKALDRFLPGD